MIKYNVPLYNLVASHGFSDFQKKLYKLQRDKLRHSSVLSTKAERRDLYGKSWFDNKMTNMIPVKL